MEKKENPVLGRLEVNFRISHPSAPTPKRLEVRDQLASLLQAAPDLIVIEKIASLHGKAESSGIARIYQNEDQMRSLEPPYLLKRMGLLKEGGEQQVEEKPPQQAEQKPSEEEKKEEEQKPPEEEKKEGES